MGRNLRFHDFRKREGRDDQNNGYDDDKLDQRETAIAIASAHLYYLFRQLATSRQNTTLGSPCCGSAGAAKQNYSSVANRCQSQFAGWTRRKTKRPRTLADSGDQTLPHLKRRMPP